MPVMPTRTSSNLSLNEDSLRACLTSVFLTTLYSTPALRNSARSLVTCSTVIPLKSRKTAADILSKRALIWPMCCSLVARIMACSCLFGLAHEVSGVDLDARPHGGADGDAPQVGA